MIENENDATVKISSWLVERKLNWEMRSCEQYKSILVRSAKRSRIKFAVLHCISVAFLALEGVPT